MSLWQISAKFNPPSLPFSCWGVFPAAVGKPRHVDGQLWRCRQVPILLLHHRAGQKHLHFPYILHDLVIFSGKKFLKTYQCWSCFVLPVVVMNQTGAWRLSSFQKRWESFFCKKKVSLELQDSTRMCFRLSWEGNPSQLTFCPVLRNYPKNCRPAQHNNQSTTVAGKVYQSMQIILKTGSLIAHQWICQVGCLRDLTRRRTACLCPPERSHVTKTTFFKEQILKTSLP